MQLERDERGVKRLHKYNKQVEDDSGCNDYFCQSKLNVSVDEGEAEHHGHKEKTYMFSILLHPALLSYIPH